MSNVLTIQEKLRDDFMPALWSAVIAGGIFSVGYGESLMTPIPTMLGNVPAGLLIGGSVFAGHLVGNVLEDHVLSLLKSSKVDTIASIVKPGLGGLATFAALKLSTGGDIDLSQAVIIGTGSVFAGQYTYDKIFKKN